MSDFSPSQRHDLHLVATLRAMSLLGDEVALVALMIRVAAHGGHVAGFMVAAISVANMLPPVLLSPYAGWIVDRVRAKQLLVPLVLYQAVVAALLALWTGPVASIFLVLLLGLGIAFTMPGYGAMVPSIVGIENMGQAQGTLQAYGGVASIAGPALGGILVGVAGQRWPLVIDAGSFVLLALGTLLLHGDRIPQRLSATRAKGELTAGMRSIWHDGLLRPLTVVVALVVLCLGIIDVALIFLLLHVMHARTWEYGLTWAVFGVGIVAGSLVSGKLSHDALPSARRTLVGVGVLGLGFAIVALMPAVGWVIVPVFVAGAANGIVNAAAGTLFMTRSHESVRGRVSSSVNAVMSSMQIVSLGFGGLLLAAWGARVVVFSSGALAVVTVAILAPFALRAGRRSEAPRSDVAV